MSADSSLTVERDRRVVERPERTLYADAYYAESGEATDRPVVAFVYGGAWETGARGQFARWALDAASEGFVAVELSYRLSDEATFPAQIRDVRAGLAWARENAESFGGDPDRLAAVGHSAGAHLAVLSALAPEGEFGDDSPVRTRPDSVVGISGPYAFDGDDEDGVTERFLGGTPEEVPHRYEAAQPVNHVSGGAPPTLLLHGEEDEVVPAESSEGLAEAMAAAGDEAEVRTYPEADHVFLHSSYWYPRVREDAFSFLRESLN